MYDFNVNEKLTAYQYLLKEKLAGDKNRELIALLKDLKLAGRQVSKELNTNREIIKIIKDKKYLSTSFFLKLMSK